MSVQGHDEIVADVASSFRAKGYRVFVIKKPIPDLLVIGGDNLKSIACEITSSTQLDKIYTKKLKYRKYGFDTDDLMIIAKGIKRENETPPEAYYLAMELIKKGMRYKKILDILKDKFDITLSRSTLSVWKKGFTKPYSVRAWEGIHKSNFIS